MKKFLSFLVLGIVALSFVGITSCSKDDDEKSKTELLTSGTWKFSIVTVNGVDFSSFYPACYKDNTISFSSNGTSVTNEGATKCDPDDPQTENGTWSFASGESKLVMDGETYNIDELTSSKLKISYTEIEDGVTLTTVVAFIH